MKTFQEASLATFNIGEENSDHGWQTQPSDVSTVYDGDTVAAASVASGDSGITS